MTDRKAEIIHEILIDNLERAKDLIEIDPKGLEPLLALIGESIQLPPPLKKWKSPLPQFITTSVSYTCSIGCEMCNAGFSDKTKLFDQYKHLSLSEFTALNPWLQSASHVALVGLGETLDSPHIESFLKSVKNKVSFISTSGIPLNEKKIRLLIKSHLHYLNLSFDGKTTAGHGSASKKYIDKFWEKVKLVQKIKQTENVSHPVLHLTIALDRENIDQLSELLRAAKKNGIFSADLIYMVPFNHSLFQKSLFPKWENATAQINAAMETWNNSGMHIRFFEKSTIENSPKVCYFVDKHIMFNLNRQRPDVCCGSIDMPIKIKNLKPETYWNSFPFRYFRSLHFSKSHEEIPEVCRSCWVLNPEKINEKFSRQNKKNLKKNYLDWYNQASLLKLEKKQTLLSLFFKRSYNLLQIHH